MVNSSRLKAAVDGAAAVRLEGQGGGGTGVGVGVASGVGEAVGETVGEAVGAMGAVSTGGGMWSWWRTPATVIAIRKQVRAARSQASVGALVRMACRA